MLTVYGIQFVSKIINLQHTVDTLKEYTKYFYQLGKKDAIEIQKLNKTTEISVLNF